MYIDKEYFNKIPGRTYFMVGVSLLIVLIASISLVYKLRRDHDSVATPTPTPTVEEIQSPHPTPSEVQLPPISPSPEVTVSVTSPSPSPTTVSKQAPASAQSSLVQFYAAYKAKDRVSLESFFSADTSEELKSLRSRLFTGMDIDGTPGGPTLFSSNSASESVSNYVITDVAALGANWKITVKESRLTASSQQGGDRECILVLTPFNTSWKIDQYYHANASGKYDGFLSQ